MAKTHKRVTDSVFLVIDPEVCCYEIIVYLHKKLPRTLPFRNKIRTENVDTYSISHNFGAELKCPKIPESFTHIMAALVEAAVFVYSLQGVKMFGTE